MAKKTMAVPPLKKRPGADPREQYIIDNAQYYCAHFFFGSSTFKNFEAATLEEATTIAQEKANEFNKIAMIYAIKDSSRAYIKSVHPKYSC